MHWHCPLCKSPFTAADKALSCENGHSFDQAKQGYFNFHLVNKKKTLKPGDSKEMVLARRDFLDLGYYAPLVQILENLLAEHFAEKVEATLLDLGCGEAYYPNELSKMASLKGCMTVYGIDISKEAIISACKRKMSKANFAVASTFDLPIMNETMDAAINIFAPFDEMELSRVLKNNGVLLRVSPGPRHLIELKTIIYQSPELHTPRVDLAILQKLDKRTTTNSISIESLGALENLKKMTPYAWKGDQQSLSQWAESQLSSKGRIEITTDFVVDIWQKDQTASSRPCR